MKTLAIIAEYNPLHDGHKYQFEKSLEQAQATHSLILMSGNFVQRGEPAITDKFTRARQAIAMGADLVLELPFIYAVNSAEFFAEGAIRILNASGVVDVLSFGSESADLPSLNERAARLLEPNHDREVKANMSDGLPYAKAVEKRLGAASRAPNDILGVQYLKALNKLDSPITPLVIKRQGSYHDEAMSVRYPSATAIRQAHRFGQLSDIHQPIFFDDLSDMIFHRLLLSPLTELHSVSEGIEHALKRAALNHHWLEDLLDTVRTPRFSLARLKRILMYSLMNYTKQDQTELQGVYYFRPLAFNDKGRELLKRIKEQNPDHFVPTVARFQGDELTQRSLGFDIDSSNLYYYLQKTKPEQTRRPSYQK